MSFEQSPKRCSRAEQTRKTMETVYAFLENYAEEHGYAPSLSEIGESCYMGRSTVLRYLDKLETKGWITRDEGHARSIRLLKTYRKWNK
jgi:SOS-response transcriptional repressor LexA